jgi:hypothetical protein
MRKSAIVVIVYTRKVVAVSCCPHNIYYCCCGGDIVDCFSLSFQMSDALGTDARKLIHRVHALTESTSDCCSFCMIEQGDGVTLFYASREWRNVLGSIRQQQQPPPTHFTKKETPYRLSRIVDDIFFVCSMVNLHKKRYPATSKTARYIDNAAKDATATILATEHKDDNNDTSLMSNESEWEAWRHKSEEYEERLLNTFLMSNETEWDAWLKEVEKEAANQQQHQPHPCQRRENNTNPCLSFEGLRRARWRKRQLVMLHATRLAAQYPHANITVAWYCEKTSSPLENKKSKRLNLYLSPGQRCGFNFHWFLENLWTALQKPPGPETIPVPETMGYVIPTHMAPHGICVHNLPVHNEKLPTGYVAYGTIAPQSSAAALGKVEATTRSYVMKKKRKLDTFTITDETEKVVQRIKTGV